MVRRTVGGVVPRLAVITLTLAGLLLGPVVTASRAGAEPALPSGFELVSYPTGQLANNLTNFIWLDDGGLLTSGKDGTITYVPPGGTPQHIAQVPSVRAIGDHGMLGFAPANDYSSTGDVYITYDKLDPDDANGHGMVEEWTASPPEAPTSFTYARTLIDGATTSPPLVQDGPTHGIDTVVVAPDDTLYVSVGDDTLNNGDPDTLRAQDINEPYGKLLHLTPDGAGVPSNPFYKAADPTSWRSRVYAYGFRNPFRFALDRRNGMPVLGDVGWNTVEEVDTVPPGMNGGWPCYEGRIQTYFAFEPQCQALYQAGTARMPIVTYRHHHHGAAVVAGMRYTANKYPTAYRGAFFYGDYVRGQIWTLKTDTAGRLTRAPEPGGFASGIGGPVAFHPGPDGDVTFADILGGTVQRLVYTTGDRPPVPQIELTTDPDTRTVQFDGTRSYDLDGDELSYSWDFGDLSPDASGPTAMHTYADGNAYTVTLTVTDQLGAEGVAAVTVHPTNHTPQVTLETPDPPRTYSVGDTVELSATATDAEDGSLPVSWYTSLLHCPFAGSCHTHPGDTTSGPTYSEPFTDHGSDTVMLITVSATDSEGGTASVTYEADPTLHTLAVDSPVAVSINGATAASAQVVAGSQVVLAAPQRSSYWRFVRWSDGQPAAHTLTMPDADLTLTATYRTAIDAKFAALPHPYRLLGRPTGPEVDRAGGRARSYLHGAIYWSAVSGAHEVHGPILTKYLARGGPHSCLGFPTSDVVGTDVGLRSRFTGGSITYLRKTGRTSVSC
jgi:glucose/arabinose dehydrogenase